VSSRKHRPFSSGEHSACRALKIVAGNVVTLDARNETLWNDALGGAEKSPWLEWDGLVFQG
jgi:hypothetical protein